MLALDEGTISALSLFYRPMGLQLFHAFGLSPLTEGSSGLTYVVDRFKGWNHGGHVTLMRGERSRLADHAAEIL